MRLSLIFYNITSIGPWITFMVRRLRGKADRANKAGYTLWRIK